MSSSTLNERLSDLMFQYQGEIIQVHKKIQEERGLHSHKLVNAYLEACRTQQPKPVVVAVEDTLAHRTERNDAKLLFDASRWAHYEGRVVQILGGVQNAGILLGGGAQRKAASSSNTQLVQALQRSNELLGVLYEQLSQDRKLHTEELNRLTQYVSSRSKKTAPSAGSRGASRKSYEDMLHSMAEDEEEEHQAKFEQDAVDWASMDEQVQENAPEAADKILSSIRVTCDGESQVFENESAARQWKMAKEYFSKSECSQLVHAE